MRDVPIVEIEAPAYVAGRYTTLVVKYRFRIVRLTLNLLKPAVTICASRHYGFMPHIQYRCTIIRKHQRLSKAIVDWNEIAVVYRIRCVVGTQRMARYCDLDVYALYTQHTHARAGVHIYAYTRVVYPTLLLRYLDRPETITLPLCSSPPYLLLKSNLFIYLFIFISTAGIFGFRPREYHDRSFVQWDTRWKRVYNANKPRLTDLWWSRGEENVVWKINLSAIFKLISY